MKKKVSIARRLGRRGFYLAYKLVRMPVILMRFLGLWLDINILKRKEYKNVCLVVNDLGEGGLEQVVMDLYKGYRKRGIEAYVVCVNENVSEYVSQLEDDPRHFRMIRRSTLAFLKFCRKNRIGIIHYHYSTFKMPFMRMLGVKLIYTIHNTYVWLSKKQWLKLWINLQFCNEIVAVSDFVKQYFEEKTGMRRVKTIINGVDLEKFGRVEKETALNRKSLGLLESDVVLLMAASFTDQKYQMALVGAMEEVRKVRPEVKIFMCGPVLNKRLFRAVKREIRERNLGDMIILGEKIERTEMGAFLKTVPDAVILTSLYEGGVPPLSVVEALSLGVPAIMTDLNLNQTVFGDYVVGVKPVFDNLAKIGLKEVEKQIYKVEAKNKADLVEKILAVEKLTDENRVKLPKKVLNEIDLERSVEKYVELVKR